MLTNQARKACLTVSLVVLFFSVTTSAQDASTTSTTGSTSVYAGLTNAPTLAGVSTAIPSLVVPDTSGAPFMKKSNLPEGTVFICVGAVMGFIGAAILAWRVIVAWSLQRSVQQTGSNYTSDSKSMSTYRPSNADFTTSNYASQNMSLERLAAQKTAYTGTTLSPVSAPKVGKRRGGDKTPTTRSLFFSPTAGTAPVQATPQNRSSSYTPTSNYLPAGYYAAGQSAANGGAPVAHVGGASTAGYGRRDSDNYSPPVTPRRLSPAKGARRDNGGSLSLGVPPTNRTPSAYLNDLFENHGFGPRERFQD